MVTFVTLLLGLLAGVESVEVAVSDEVAAVVYRLDGVEIGRVDAEPWRLDVDLGSDLAPHRLEVVALDEAGRELDRSEQRINLLREEAEMTIVLARGPREGRVATLNWRTVSSDVVERVEASLDGQPLLADDEGRLVLPTLHPDSLSFLSVTLYFESGRVAREEVVFGGLYGDEVNVDLTAVPVVVAPEARQARSRSRQPEQRSTETLPGPEMFAGRILVDRRPVRPVSLDRPLPEILFVVDAQSTRNLRRLARGARSTTFRTRGSGLGLEDRLGVVSAYSIADAGAGTDIFDLAPLRFPRRDERPLGSLLALLAEHSSREAQAQGSPRLFDAVAVAGMVGEGRGRPRAVVLVRNGHRDDASRFRDEAVAEYLETLRVPLQVWNLEGKASAGEASEDQIPENSLEERSISSVVEVERAMRELVDQIDSQRILWLEGRHLPQQIALRDPPAGMSLLGDR